jgi:signal transduction histidine kinase
VSTALNMRLARSRLRDDPDVAEQLLDGAGDELDAALEELRELARGIHPALLSDRGLDTALEALAHRTPLPVELRFTPREDVAEAVELAAYFVVSEALTNVVKYARASHATVDVAQENGRLLVRVADDGVGGADPEQGTGLRGLVDRLAVLEGRLEIDSQPGRGTTITARIPCA